VANLLNPTLTIKLVAGTNSADVTATVTTKLTDFEKVLVKEGLRFRLKCKLRGEDSGFNGSDDDVFSFPSKTIAASGLSTFTHRISRDTLDEDWEGNDEIYARFTLQSLEPIFPFVKTKDSAVITGNF